MRRCQCHVQRGSSWTLPNQYTSKTPFQYGSSRPTVSRLVFRNSRAFWTRSQKSFRSVHILESGHYLPAQGNQELRSKLRGMEGMVAYASRLRLWDQERPQARRLRHHRAKTSQQAARNGQVQTDALPEICLQEREIYFPRRRRLTLSWASDFSNAAIVEATS